MGNHQTTDRYKWVVLATLTMVYVFNFIDRQVLVILQEPIKAELGLSDTQLGLLTGLTFAALYVILGIPIARLADKGNRRNIIVVSLAFWSLMTAVSGASKNFLQLFLSRVGIGIGEAGGSPPAHSIISDYFPPKQRATALVIYSSGVYIGILLGFVIGGLIAQSYGWRIAFYSLGIPGIAFAIVLYFVVKEPIKGRLDAVALTGANLSLKEVIKTLAGKKTFIYLALATGFLAFGSYGFGNFSASFLARTHQVDVGTAGIMLGLVLGIGGMIGTFFGGFLADNLSQKDIRWHIWLPMIVAVPGFFFFYLILFSESLSWVYFGMLMSTISTAVFFGPTIAVIHSLVNAKMRAFSSAVWFFIMNLIGLGLGPLTIGVLSDYLQPEYGDLSLRWAFCAIFITGFISISLFYLASKSYKSDLESSK
jgi:predicted MFS family arabinose efflux permease